MNDELKIYEEKMKKTIGVLADDFAGIRAGQASPALLDRVMVDYYGTPTKITQIANVSVPEPRILTVSPYDKTALKNIEKAIQSSELGINPTNDGSVIRMVFPQLTEERRKELCKGVGKTAEESKVAIRSIRRDGIEKVKQMKKNGDATEDDVKILEGKMQKLTDRFIEEIDKLAAAKEKDILSI